MSSGRLSWGHLTVWIHTRFKHAVNIQKVLVWGSLKQCQFYCWPLTPSATVGKQAVNTRSVSTLKGHAPIFPLACVCDFLKHCCVNKPKWDRKDGVCPGHVDVWRLRVKKGHWHKRGLLLWGVKRKNQHKVNIKKKLMTMKKRKKETFTGEKRCATSAEMNDRRHNLKVREGKSSHTLLPALGAGKGPPAAPPPH